MQLWRRRQPSGPRVLPWWFLTSCARNTLPPDIPVHQGLLHTRRGHTLPSDAFSEGYRGNNCAQTSVRQTKEDQVRDEAWPGISFRCNDAGEGGGITGSDTRLAIRRHGSRPVPDPGDAAVLVPGRAEPGPGRGQRRHGVQAGRARAGLPRGVLGDVRLGHRPDARVPAPREGHAVAPGVPGERAGRQDLPGLRPLPVACLRLWVPGAGGGVHPVLGAGGGPEGAQAPEQRPPALGRG